MGLYLGGAGIAYREKPVVKTLSEEEKTENMINEMTNDEKIEFYKNLEEKKGDNLLEYYTPKFRIDTYRSDELRAIEYKKHLKINLWEKIRGKTDLIKENMERKIVQSIEHDYVRHNSFINRYLSKADEYLELVMIVKGNADDYNSSKIRFFKELYLLDRKMYQAFENGDNFLRDNLLNISDSFRDRYQELDNSVISQIKKAEILRKWQSIVENINIKNNERTTQSFLDLSDIEYSISIINGMED